MVEAEQTSFWLRAFGPYWVSTWIMIICNGVVPQIFWFKWARTHIPTIFVVSTLINVGMWFERYVIIITGLSREYNPAVWGHYTPSIPELLIVIGSFAFFSIVLPDLPEAVPGDPDLGGQGARDPRPQPRPRRTLGGALRCPPWSVSSTARWTSPRPSSA
jgi:hypothetical protein